MKTRTWIGELMKPAQRRPFREFVEEDLDYLYVVVPRDDGSDTELTTARKMSDRQFREWIVAKGEMHKIQILPTFGRLGIETRLALINRLIRNGVHIYLAPKEHDA